MDVFVNQEPPVEDYLTWEVYDKSAQRSVPQTAPKFLSRVLAHRTYATRRFVESLRHDANTIPYDMYCKYYTVSRHYNRLAMPTPRCPLAVRVSSCCFRPTITWQFLSSSETAPGVSKRRNAVPAYVMKTHYQLPQLSINLEVSFPYITCFSSDLHKPSVRVLRCFTFFT
jgi:hypothetical protein